jgi:hypothetical protein
MMTSALDACNQAYLESEESKGDMIELGTVVLGQLLVPGIENRRREVSVLQEPVG